MSPVPLVSIGVPTCNRAPLLQRAIYSLLGQDYSNLEIIISDNASDDRTSEVSRRIQLEHPLVRYCRVPQRLPPFKNFRNALLQARGDYFMWASDDDLWEPNFISFLAGCLDEDPRLLLVAAEAQYMLTDGTRLPFFPEGCAFYDWSQTIQLRRMLTTLLHGYGNLIYGLYRRESLLQDGGRTALDSCSFVNETPIFLQVAARGTIRVRNRILFYKSTSLPTYLQACREYGFAPVLNAAQSAESSAMPRPTLTETKEERERPDRSLHVNAAAGEWVLAMLRSLSGNSAYHFYAMKDIAKAIWGQADTNSLTKFIVLISSAAHIAAHLVKLSLIWPAEDLLDRIRHG